MSSSDIAQGVHWRNTESERVFELEIPGHLSRVSVFAAPMSPLLQ